MKFMQRAAASPTSPSTPDGPSPKRQKTTDDGSPEPVFDVNALADNRAIKAAMAEEENKRQAALERAGAAAGDTRWVLDFAAVENAPSPVQRSTLKVVQTGYGLLDGMAAFSHGEDESASPMVGRRSFGRFNRVIEVR